MKRHVILFENNLKKYGGIYIEKVSAGNRLRIIQQTFMAENNILLLPLKINFGNSEPFYRG